MKYYDCHSHHNSTRPNHIAIRSIDLKIDGELSTKLDSPFTIGIHPWSSESCRTEDLKKVKELLGHSNCFGLGEIGLDKIKGAPLENQIEIMEQQLKMAWEANISTVVLHCVRSFNEIFPLVKNHSKDFDGKIPFGAMTVEYDQLNDQVVIDGDLTARLPSATYIVRIKLINKATGKSRIVTKKLIILTS